MFRHGRRLSLLALTAAVLVLAGCSTPTRTPTVTRTPTATPRPTGTSAAVAAIPWQPSGRTTVLETGLESPWSVVPLPSGSALISERDSGTIRERLPQGGLRTVGTVPGVVHTGESGLLGLAVQAESAPKYLYAYLTTADDNRVVRLPLSGVPGSYAIGAPEPVLTGIPKASNHDGGRLAFGPDGMLYVTAGDASNPGNAQDVASLGGKILRITPEGQVPGDNPFPGSPVWSYGHRNPQGIGWDSRGTMWASEFGQNTWDELNIIRPGSNYGWPTVEGVGGDPKYTDPVYQWPTDAASPSGLAVVGDTIFLAALRGERLWTAWPTDGAAPVTAAPFFEGELGRLRDVVAVGDRLWLLTNNTDGRGSPRSGDDRLVEVPLVPAQAVKRPG
ncbi:MULTISPECIES: PQQ-dependent sugar dehydrogenase [unclassified Leifsonia]|uniref:PQQ-dependent sugar dehydrogenase n=1 Tax=unclassified Leifsonia TaxID=2663824 RepID=UPI00036A5151|nr:MULTISPECIES: PQQ-dependent sugar dehydrogenase [unclassified Leifsonia]TDP99076.1 glucose/arabinose dehydrogenase [Leifsonia sp. 115AMFTsu3.1]